MSVNLEFTSEFGDLTFWEPGATFFPASDLFESIGFAHLTLDRSVAPLSHIIGFPFTAGDSSASCSSLTSKGLIYQKYSPAPVCWSPEITLGSPLTLWTQVNLSSTCKNINSFLIIFLYNSFRLHFLNVDPLDPAADRAEPTGQPEESTTEGWGRFGLRFGLGSLSFLVSPPFIKCNSEAPARDPPNEIFVPDNLSMSKNSTLRRSVKQQTRSKKKTTNVFHIAEENKRDSIEDIIIKFLNRLSSPSDPSSTSTALATISSPSVSEYGIFHQSLTGNVLFTLPTNKVSTMSKDHFKSHLQQISKHFFAPPSFQSFNCTMSSNDKNVDAGGGPVRSPNQPQAEYDPDSRHTEKKKDEGRRGPTTASWTDEASEEKDSKHHSHHEITLSTKEDTTNNKLSTSLPAGSLSAHICIHKSHSAASFSVSRHEGRGDGVPSDDLLDSDSERIPTPETGLEDFDDEPGVVRDPENEGDREILLRKTSGKSNLTSDIDQLQPHYTSPEHMEDQPTRELAANSKTPMTTEDTELSTDARKNEMTLDDAVVKPSNN